MVCGGTERSMGWLAAEACLLQLAPSRRAGQEQQQQQGGPASLLDSVLSYAGMEGRAGEVQK